MSLNDRSDGSMFKGRTSVFKREKLKSKGTLTLRYAQDQMGLLSEYLTNHDTQPSSYSLDVYSKANISLGGTVEHLELDLQRSEYINLGGSRYRTSSMFYAILEVVDASEGVMNKLAIGGSETAKIVYSTDNLGLTEFDASYISDKLFKYQESWYLAIRRDLFVMPGTTKTMISADLQVDGATYARGNLSEYINVVDSSAPVNEGEESQTLLDFDYAVIRYSWGESGGIDLDTRTQLVQPFREKIVGYGRDSSDGDILQWAGDNTGMLGGESVLISIKAMLDEYPEQDEFEIALRAFWYNTRNSGNFSVGIKTYLGGESPDAIEGYDWSIPGSRLVQQFTMVHNVESHGGGSENAGVQIAKVIFNKSTRVGRLIGMDGATPVIPEDSPTIQLRSMSGDTLFSGTADKLTLINSANEIVYKDE